MIRYTTDGSRPTSQSPLWDSTGPREPGEVFHLTTTTTFRWLAEDIKGNVSRGSQHFVITARQIGAIGSPWRSPWRSSPRRAP